MNGSSPRTQYHAATGHTRPVTAVAISRDGSRGVTVGLDRTIRLWDLDQPVEIDRLTWPAVDIPHDVAMAPDGRSFVVASSRGVIVQFDIVD